MFITLKQFSNFNVIYNNQINSTLYKCESNKKPYVIKHYNINDSVNNNIYNYIHVINEIKISTSIQHKNIINTLVK